MRKLGLLILVVSCASTSNCSCSNGNSVMTVQDLSGPGTPDGMVPSTEAAVLQLHHHANRDGVYTDAKLTRANAAALHLDGAFDGTYAQASASGPVYAQPLFVDEGGTGDFVIVATESNDVLAFDATTGKVKWHADATVIGKAGGGGDFNCGNVVPSGITGTPVIDLATRAIFFQADVAGQSGTTHLIHSLSIDDGTERAGWPIEVKSIIPDFGDRQQGERGALLILAGKVYVPFGGRYGDCTPYRGYVIGLPLSNPTPADAVVFKTAAQDGGGDGAAGGIWAPTGLSSDGTSIYFTTGNAQGTFPTVWTQSYTEAVFKLPPSLTFDMNDTTAYFAPTDWHNLDTSDTDLSGSGVLVVDLPSSSTPRLLVTFGKDSNLYVVNRDNLGGITANDGLFNASVASSEIINAPSWYTTKTATYVTFRASCPGGGPATINAVPITNAPAAGSAWCANVPGGGSPIVSTTGDGNDTIVWFVSAEGEGVSPDYKLYGFDGDTGAQVAATESMSMVRRFSSPIVAKGRVYVASDRQLYSFVTP